ncbi:MAG: YceI family protein, partial [Bacteroidota bacterium]
KITGDLTMRGITKTVELDAAGIVIEHPMTKKPVAGFKVLGKIKRSDFGIGSGFAEAMLSDEVVVRASAEFNKKQ